MASDEKNKIKDSVGSKIKKEERDGSTKSTEKPDTIKRMPQKKAAKKSQYLEIDYDDLELKDRIGRGAYGSVYHALWKSRDKVVAVKKLLQLENEVNKCKFFFLLIQYIFTIIKLMLFLI